MTGFAQDFIQHVHGQCALSLNRFEYLCFQGFIFLVSFGIFRLDSLQITAQERHLLLACTPDDHVT